MSNVTPSRAQRMTQLEIALRNADAAGDTVAAQTLANEIRRARSTPNDAAPAPAAPAQPPRWQDAPIVEPSTITPDQERAVATARARRRRSDAENPSPSPRWQDAPVVQDANGQRYESGVPVGGRAVSPAPTDSATGTLPALPPGFVLEPSSARSVPPLPPGFVMDDQSGPGSPGSSAEPMTFDNGGQSTHYRSARDRQFGGAAMNATAGVNEGLYAVAGAPVDIVRGAMNLASRGVRAITGADLGQIPDDSFGGSRWIGETMGAIRPELDPANTVAMTTAERVARGGGQGVGSVVAPAGVVGAMARGGMLSARGAGAGEAMFGRAGSVGDATLGAAGGAGAAVGQEMAPEGYETAGALAGGLLAPGAGYAAVRGAQAAVAPFHAGGRQAMAGRRLLDGASDEARLRESLVGSPEPLVLGSQPTTFQRTGDLGIGGMEKDAANRFPERFAERRGEQNAARVTAMRGVVPDGAPEKVAATVRQRLEAIEAETERMIGAATEQARQSAGAMGAPMAPEVAGGAMRNAIEEARSAAKAQERALWSAVDPDGSLALSAANARRQAAETIKGMPASAKPPSGEEAAILSTLGQYPAGAVPFGEITAMSSRIKAELRAERMANGESPAYARLSRLNAALQSDLDTAIAGKVASEAEAVAAGRMSVAETIDARIQGWADNWLGERQAVSSVGGGQDGPVSYAAGGPSAVPGVRGAASATGGRSGGPAGDPRLSGRGVEPNFDAEALGRLNAANAATRQRVETFDNRTLGPIRQRLGTTAPYTMPAGAVPAQVFSASPRSPEAIARLRSAIGEEAATEALHGYAVGQVLRAAARPNGTLDAARLNAWRRTHADALRAVPGLDAKLADAGRASEAIAEVAAARAAAATAAQKGALGRLVGVDAPEDVTRIVGGLFSRQDAVAQFRQLSRAIGDDAEAKKGLRRAVLEHMTVRFVGNVEVGTTGVGGMRPDGFQNFVRQNGAALREAGFGSGELRVLDAIAADLQRSGRSTSSVRNPGGSDTAQNLFARVRGQTPFGTVASLLGAPGVAGVGVGATTGTMQGLAAGAAAGLIMAMRNAGLRSVDDLVADALLNPDRARLLLQKVPEGQEGEWLRKLSRSFANTAVRDAGAVPATDATTPATKRHGSIATARRESATLAQAPDVMPSSPLALALLAQRGQPGASTSRPDALLEALTGRA